MAIIRGRRTPADRLSASLARLLTRDVRGRAATTDGTGSLIGIEHEFRVGIDDRWIDFRHVIHTLPIAGRRVDPADPNAYRCTWGGTITADGREAEIAIPPIVVGPGGIGRALAAAARGRAELAAVLPPGASLEGYSTHLSVATPPGLAERAAELYVRHFALAMSMLLDGPASPGLLVRPRAGRLELGGEYADGPTLAAALTFAIGSARAVAREASRRRPGRSRLPPALEVEAMPAIERYGWFVGDGELGADLHRLGRAARLRRRDRGEMTADAHLVAAWSAARRELSDLDESALELVDDLVAGRRALGIERPAETTTRVASGTNTLMAGADAGAAGAADALDPLGAAMRERVRPGFRVEPAIVSWDFVVLRLDDGSRGAYACFPRAVLGDALAALDDGRLDALLGAYLDVAKGDGRTLSSNRQTSAAGLYGSVAKGADLLAGERDPIGGGGKRQRRQERRQDDKPRPRSDSKRVVKAAGAAGAAAGLTLFGLPAALVAAAAGTVGVALVGGALLLGGGSSAASATPASSAAALVSAAPTVSGPLGPTPTPSPSPSPSATPIPIAFEVGTATGTLATGGGHPGSAALFQNDAKIGGVTILDPGTVTFDVRSAGTGAALAIAGTARTDPTPTGAGLSLSFGSTAGAFTSDAGECTIQVTSIGPTRVEGIFACPAIVAVGGDPTALAAASGTFAFDTAVAQPPATPTPRPTAKPTAKPTATPVTALTTGSGSLTWPGGPFVEFTKLQIGQLAPGNVALMWVAIGKTRTGEGITDSALIFGTDLPAGKYVTSADTGVQITLSDGSSATSTGGECTLQVARPKPGFVNGSMDCRVLPGLPQGLVAKFDAAP